MPAPWSAAARVRVVGRIHNQVTNNVFNLATNTNFDPPTDVPALLNQLATAVKECIQDTLLPGVTSEWQFLHVEAALIHPGPSDPIIVAADENQVGTSATNGHTFASQLVDVRTGGGGKSGRGRMFLPPAGEDTATQGSWDPAAVALIAAFCACMAGKFIGANPSTIWRFGVFSRKKVGNPPVVQDFNVAFREAISLTPVPLMSHLARRKVGRGV